MKKRGLTEKSMANKHFYQTELAILIGFYRFRDHLSAQRIARYAGISRSTLYRHHHSIYKIPHDCEEYLLSSYTRAIQKLLQKPRTQLRLIYLRTFVFISSHKVFFRALFASGHKGIIKRMLRHLRPKITKSWPHNVDPDQPFSIYGNEILSLIELWGRSNFSLSMLDELLTKALYLTEVAPRHLAPIAKKSQQSRRV